MSFADQFAQAIRPQRRSIAAGGHIPILPLSHFDAAIREEAKQLILGTNEYLHFAEDGTLQQYHYHDDFERVVQKKAITALVAQARANPEAMQQRLEKAAENLRGHKRSDRLKELDAMRDGWDDGYDNGVEIDEESMEEFRALNRAYAIEHARLKREYNRLKHAVELTHIDETVEKLHALIDGAKDMVRVLTLPENQNAEDLVFPENYDSEACKREMDFQTALNGLCSFLGKAMTYLPVAEADTRSRELNALVVPYGSSIRSYDRPSDEAERSRQPALGAANGLINHHQQVLAAAMMMLANGIDAESLDERIEAFNRQVTLKVSSHDDSIARHIRGNNSNADLAFLWGDRDNNRSMEQRMDRLGTTLGELETILKDPQAEDDFNRSLPMHERSEAETYSDPKFKLKYAMRGAIAIADSGENIMRFHNSHPQVVNFIRASEAMQEFSIYSNDYKLITDPASFFGSPWTYMMGSAELQVDPALLAMARSKLLGQERSL